MHRHENKGFGKVARFMQSTKELRSFTILQERMERGAYGTCKE